MVKYLKSLWTLYNKPMLFLSVVNVCVIIGLLGVNLATFLGMQPCMLCNIQRFICFGIAIITGTSLVYHGIAGNEAIDMKCAKVTGFALVVSHVFAWYQFGVEKDLFPLPPVCRANNFSGVQSGDILQILSSNPSAPCNKAQYVLGISIGELTLIGTGAMVILLILFAFARKSHRNTKQR